MLSPTIRRRPGRRWEQQLNPSLPIFKHGNCNRERRRRRKNPPSPGSRRRDTPHCPCHRRNRNRRATITTHPSRFEIATVRHLCRTALRQRLYPYHIRRAIGRRVVVAGGGASAEGVGGAAAWECGGGLADGALRFVSLENGVGG